MNRYEIDVPFVSCSNIELKLTPITATFLFFPAWVSCGVLKTGVFKAQYFVVESCFNIIKFYFKLLGNYMSFRFGYKNELNA